MAYTVHGLVNIVNLQVVLMQCKNIESAGDGQEVGNQVTMLEQFGWELERYMKKQ